MKENMKKYNFLKFNLRGHCLWLHLCWWTGNPLHSLPPLTGAGLLHSRVLVIVPNPHVTLHVEKLDQGDQLPSSREIHMCQLLKWFQLLKYLFYDDKIQFCMCYWITASFSENGVNYQFNCQTLNMSLNMCSCKSNLNNELYKRHTICLWFLVYVFRNKYILSAMHVWDYFIKGIWQLY